MYSVVNQTEEFETVDQECKKLLREIFVKIEPHVARMKLEAGKKLETEENFYMLREGVMRYAINDTLLFYFDEGDFIGHEQWLDCDTTSITSEFAVTLDVYRKKDLLEHIRADAGSYSLWNKFVSKQFSLYASVLGALAKFVSDIHPKILHYSKGETIITEGSLSDDVFLLVQGVAGVSVSGMSVGQLSAEDIFGAVAAISGQPRKATVVASSRCMVLMLPRNEFLGMLQSKPLNFLRTFTVEGAGPILV